MSQPLLERTLMNPLNSLKIIQFNELLSYPSALSLQSRLVAHKLKNRSVTPDYLLLLQHEPCVTLGRRSHLEPLKDLKLDRNLLPIYKSPRGGKVSYHGPGQLTCYPIIDLKRLGSGLGFGIPIPSLSLENYVAGLAAVMKDSLETIFKINDLTYDSTPERVGLWIPPNNKIGFIGIQVQQWITSHGFCINVTPECLSGFKEIDPCGLRNSMPNSDLNPDLNLLKFNVTCALSNLPIGSKMIDYSSDVLMAILQEAVIKSFTNRFNLNKLK